MKKFLPKTINNPSGFTLIELMVVISIIAILSVIGVTMFNNVQKNARDSVRKQDIDSIAKALEVNYDLNTSKYVPLATAQFAGGAVPADTYSGTAKCGNTGTLLCEYCVRNVAGTAMTKGPNTATCPAGGTKATNAKPPIDTAFEVCATLETGAGASNYYCKSNSR